MRSCSRSQVSLGIICALTVGCGDSARSSLDSATQRDGSTAKKDGSTAKKDSATVKKDSATVKKDGSTVKKDSAVAPPPGCQLNQWQTKILKLHNQWRGSVQPAAAKMLRLRWDKTIAANAAKWVASCDPDWPHSPESSRKGIGGYKILGENLNYCAGSSCKTDPQITDGSGIGEYGEGWWNERKKYDWTTDSGSGTSHYTQMVSSNVYAIGCATQSCPAPGPYGWNGKWWWTICQYGPRGQAFWSGTKPYLAGSGGLVEPPNSVYALHPGLCK